MHNDLSYLKYLQSYHDRLSDILSYYAELLCVGVTVYCIFVLPAVKWLTASIRSLRTPSVVSWFSQVLERSSLQVNLSDILLNMSSCLSRPFLLLQFSV